MVLCITAVQHEDLSSDPCHPYRELSVAVHVCDPNPGQGGNRKLFLGAWWLPVGPISELWLQ